MCHNIPPALVSLMNKLMDELFTPQSVGKRPPLLTPTSEKCEGSALRAVCHLQQQNHPFPCAAGYPLENLQFKPDPAWLVVWPEVVQSVRQPAASQGGGL